MITGLDFAANSCSVMSHRWPLWCNRMNAVQISMCKSALRSSELKQRCRTMSWAHHISFKNSSTESSPRLTSHKLCDKVASTTFYNEIEAQQF